MQGELTFSYISIFGSCWLFKVLPESDIIFVSLRYYSNTVCYSYGSLYNMRNSFFFFFKVECRHNWNKSGFHRLGFLGDSHLIWQANIDSCQKESKITYSFPAICNYKDLNNELHKTNWFFIQMTWCNIFLRYHVTIIMKKFYICLFLTDHNNKCEERFRYVSWIHSKAQDWFFSNWRKVHQKEQEIFSWGAGILSTFDFIP